MKVQSSILYLYQTIPIYRYFSSKKNVINIPLLCKPHQIKTIYIKRIYLIKFSNCLIFIFFSLYLQHNNISTLLKDVIIESIIFMYFKPQKVKS